MRVLIALLLGTVTLEASPFLVCDPYPGSGDPNLIPTTFEVTGVAGTPVSSPAFTNPDGTKILHYDLATLANGNYTVTATAVNVFGGASPSSAPFTFTKGVPAQPGGLRISPQ